jgi:hypothetical protein
MLLMCSCFLFPFPLTCLRCVHHVVSVWMQRISEDTSFKTVVEKIPGPDPNDRARQAVSVPLCFICLLHLANEKHLHLEGSEDLKNVRIFSD